MKKPAAKKTADPSKTKPFNVQLMKPSELIKDKPKAKPAAKKTMTKAPAKKAKELVGPAAVEALQKRVSPAGVKKAEMDAKKAIAKKYPGLTKKSK
jgi:hypothetical protein